MLLRTLLELLEGWRPAFSQSRSHRRALAQALGTLTSFGRRTLSRALCALGHQQQDWSAEYRLHARADTKLRPESCPSGLPANRFCRAGSIPIRHTALRPKSSSNGVIAAAAPFSGIGTASASTD